MPIEFFAAAHCVVVWATLQSCTFAEMDLDSTTMFPLGTSVMFICIKGQPVLAQVVGHSESGDAYRRITYDRDGKTVLHDRASFRRLSLPRAPSPPRFAQSEASSLTRAEQRALVHRRPKRSLQSTLHAFLKPRDPPQDKDEDVIHLAGSLPRPEPTEPAVAVDAVRLDCRKGLVERCAYHFIGAVFFSAHCALGNLFFFLL